LLFSNLSSNILAFFLLQVNKNFSFSSIKYEEPQRRGERRDIAEFFFFHTMFAGFFVYVLTAPEEQNVYRKPETAAVNCNGWLSLFDYIPSQECRRIELMCLLEPVLLLLKS